MVRLNFVMTKLRQIAQLGAPVLRRRAEEIIEMDSAATRSIISDMRATLAESNGVGIAAPQIYESCRILIVASRPTPRYPYAPQMDPTVMINPSWSALSEVTEKDWEGCLSIPGIRALVPRHKSIEVNYTTPAGDTIQQRLDDFVARVFQHEYDHLNGLVYLDRVENNQDIVSEKEFNKLIAERP